MKKQGMAGALALVLALALALSLCACGPREAAPAPAAPDTAVSGETQTPEAPAEKDSYGVGEQAELNGVEVTLTQVEESRGNQFMEPEAGKVYLLCHFDIANNTQEDLSISSLLCFDAYVDDYAASLSIGAESATDQAGLDGTVAPGKRMAGVIGYEVAQDWKELEIVFTPDAWSNDSLTFTAQRAE